MSTVIRADISKKNKYYIDKHRYYELKHFCLQYPSWKKKLINFDYMLRRDTDISVDSNQVSDPTERMVEVRDLYLTRTEIIETAAIATDRFLGPYILEGVTNGLSYEKLNARKQIPCNKDTYYQLYRKFFFILNDIRS